MNSSTDVESRSSRHHLWWKSKYFIYDIMMHILLLAFNVTTFLYVRHHKLPIPGDMLLLVICYGFTGIVGVVSWGFILKYTPEMDFRGGCTDRLSHFLALCSDNYIVVSQRVHPKIPRTHQFSPKHQSFTTSRIFESNQHPHVLAFVDQGGDDYPDEDMPGAVRKSHQPTPMLKKSFPDNTTCRDDDPAIGQTLVDPHLHNLLRLMQLVAPMMKLLFPRTRHTLELHEWRFSAYNRV
uniref:Uncharacterized protein n=1 Tax=Brassica campestris TaxID=3711 RepID=M4EUD8_BRACM